MIMYHVASAGGEKLTYTVTDENVQGHGGRPCRCTAAAHGPLQLRALLYGVGWQQSAALSKLPGRVWCRLGSACCKGWHPSWCIAWVSKS